MHYRPLPTSTSDAILREMFIDFGTIVEGVKRGSHAFITGIYSHSPTRKCTKYLTIPNPLHSAGSDSNRSLQLILLFRLGKMEGEVSFLPMISNGPCSYHIQLWEIAWSVLHSRQVARCLICYRKYPRTCSLGIPCSVSRTALFVDSRTKPSSVTKEELR